MLNIKHWYGIQQCLYLLHLGQGFTRQKVCSIDQKHIPIITCQIEVNDASLNYLLKPKFEILNTSDILLVAQERKSFTISKSKNDLGSVGIKNLFV